MTDAELISMFVNLRRWNRGQERAPHKPLLALLALARIQQNMERLVPFDAIEERLTDLLRSFGPPRDSYHPEYPFWRLQADGLWEVRSKTPLLSRKGNSDPTVTALRTQLAEGGFVEAVDAHIRKSPRVLVRIAQALLQMAFPASFHDEIISALGLDLQTVVVERDPEFRRTVLRAYEYRCAFCGYDGRLDDASIGIEAAHVQWHCYGGPSTVDNGIALCSLHHKAFDMGAMGIAVELRILVSVRVNGGPRTSDAITSLSGRGLVGPQPGQPQIAASRLRWHQANVFKAPSRSAASAQENRHE